MKAARNVWETGQNYTPKCLNEITQVVTKLKHQGCQMSSN